MRYIWRLQQSQMIVGVFYWSLTLAGIFFPYFQPVFVRLGLISSSQVAIGLFILIVLVFVAILIIGYLYDKVFKMWAEKRVVDIERNIYFHTKMSAKEIVHWQYYHIPVLENINCRAEAAFYQRWNERLMEDDEVLRKDVYKTAKWVREYDLRPMKSRWLKSVKDQLYDKYEKNQIKKPGEG